MGTKARTKDPLLVSSLIIICLFLVVALLPKYFAPYDPIKQDIRARLHPPDWSLAKGKHLLGTDQYGRDIFSRIVWGTRISVFIGFTASTMAVLLGVLLGITAGWWSGWFGSLIMRIADIQLAFPFLVLAIAMVATIGPSVITIVLILSFWNWAEFGKVTNAMTNSIKGREFVLSASAIGCSTIRIMAFYILPGLLGPILVLWSTIAGVVIIVEGSLSFLGFGVQPPTPSWGAMLSEGRGYLGIAWWISTFPGLAILLIVLAFNTLADSLQNIRGRY